MRDYIIRRLLLLPVIILGVTFMTFLAYRIIPGNAADLVLRLMHTRTLAAMWHQYGWIEHSYRRLTAVHGTITVFGDWLLDVAQGDLGTSFAYRTEVTNRARTKASRNHRAAEFSRSSLRWPWVFLSAFFPRFGPPHRRTGYRDS